MKKILYLFVLTTIFFLTSCSKGGDGPLFKCNFAGVWEGEFTGDDSGFMSGIVTSECKVSGSTYSYALDQYDDLNATLDSTGYFSGSSTNGAVFEGQINQNSGSGTWINLSYASAGTWTISKISADSLENHNTNTY